MTKRAVGKPAPDWESRGPTNQGVEMSQTSAAAPAGTQIGLVPEFSYRADLKPPVGVGPGPFGTRMFYEIAGGTFSGGRLNGTIGTGGGDWLLVGPDGFGRLDVRGQLLTDDGAVIYISYHGVLEMNAKVQAFVERGEGTGFADQYFRTSPRLETGDERYAWVQQSIFVAEGRLYPGGVEYSVSRVV